MKFASILPLLALSALGFAQPGPTNELIFTDTKAIGLMPPVVVSQGMSHDATWSPDGKYLLIASQEMKLTPSMVSDFIAKGKSGPPTMPEQVVTIYNVEKQVSSTVWRGRMDVGQLGQVAWLPSSRLALVILDQPFKSPQGEMDTKQTVYSVSPTTGKLVQFYAAGADEHVSISTEPDVKGAILVVRKYSDPPSPDQVQTRFTWIAPDGRVGGSINVKGRPGFGQIAWVTPDRPMLVAWLKSSGDKPVQVWSDMDFASGQLRVAATPKMTPSADKEADFKLILGSSQSVGENKSVTLKAAWLVAKAKGPHQSTLVAAEVDESSLSPGLNAVFYTTKGVGMVRSLMALPKEVALKALEAAEKARLMSESKQIGMAFMMYAADWDDMLPAGGSDWMEAIFPYSKDRNMLSGFVYTFGGGNMADIKNPAQTELGYKQGPGGRAILYADGHVKWIPD